MKKILGTAVLASALSMGVVDNAEAKNVKHPRATQKNECKSDEVIKNARNQVFILVDGPETGKNLATYCREGKVLDETSITTGSPHKDGGTYTPEWIFSVKELQRHRKSTQYNNAPMPFSMHLIRGIFGHEGEVIRNGKVLEYASHGCVRFPHGAAERFFNLVKADLKAGKDVKFVIRGTDPRK